MKKLIALTLSLILLLSLASCATEKEDVKEPLTNETNTLATQEEEVKDNTTVRLLAMTGPTGMGLAELLHNDKEGSGNKCDYEASLVSSPDQVVAPIAGNQCDIAAVPINLASTLYKKTNGNIVVLCANTLGVLYITENGETVKSVADLKGKTIYAPNPGSTPEYVLRYVLKENGIDPDKDVTLEFLPGGDEVAAKLANTPGAIGMLPEPKISAFLSQNTSFRICLDMTEEWDKVAGEGNTLVQGVFVARRAFVEEHPALVKDFLDDYNASQKTVNTDLEKGAELVVEAGIIPKAPLAKKAIPGANITFLEGKEMTSAVSKCLQILFEANPQSVGGSLPGDDIYYAR